MQKLSQVQSKLDVLSTDKLIQIVKNYKQYGYDEEVKNYTLALLETRGMSIEDLRLSGNLENHNYTSAQRLYEAFVKNSKFAFAGYLALVGWVVVTRMIGIEYNGFGLAVSIVSIIIFVTYLLFLLQSFLNQSQFYKAVGEDYSNGAIIYLFVGMPFYIIMFFVFTKEMREKMQAIQ